MENRTVFITPRSIERSLLRLIFGIAAMLPAIALAQEIRLDVVGDVTEAGKKFVHPTPDKPVYYFPETVGYKEMGNYLRGEKPPPLTPEVEHMIAKALYEQGYRVMTKQSAPSLLLVFWWGYMAPQMLDATAASGVFGGISGAVDSQGAGIGASDNSGGQTSSGVGGIFINQGQMLTLLAGDKYDSLPQGSMPFRNPPLRDEVDHAALTPRYYVMVTAFDFQAALQKKRVRIWTARMSTARAGTTLDKVLPALITAGGPIFGRDTPLPTFIQMPVDPTGRVIVGAPQVKDFPSAPAPLR